MVALCLSDTQLGADGARPDPQQLVVDHLGLARHIAQRRHRKTPYLDLGDFEGAAFEGLVQASRAWRPEFGTRFARFATYRIVGAIKDWQRSTWVVDGLRYQRDKARDLGQDLPKAVGLGLEKMLGDCETGAQRFPLALSCKERGYNDTDVRLTLQSILERTALTAQQHHLIEARLEGRMLADIGEEMGVSESRACQIEGEAMALLGQVALEDVEAQP